MKQKIDNAQKAYQLCLFLRSFGDVCSLFLGVLPYTKCLRRTKRQWELTAMPLTGGRPGSQAQCHPL
ncbi:unnamed protein product [Ixodes pacificus]